MAKRNPLNERAIWQRNADRYGVLFEENNDAIFVAEARTRRLIDCNKKAEKVIGYPKKKILSMKADELHPRELVRHTIEIFKKQAQGSKVVSDTQLLTRDKKRIPVSVSATPVRVGGKAYLLGIFHDVSERQKAAEDLFKSEERFRLVAENMGDYIWIVDMNLRYTYVSSSVRRIRGYRSEEMIGRHMHDSLVPSSFKVAMGKFSQQIQLEKSKKADPYRSETMEIEIYRKDGSKFWAEIKMSFMRDAEGRAIGVMGVTRDITERKKSDAKLQKLLSLQRATLESTADGILVVDGDRNITDFNEQFLKLWKIPKRLIGLRGSEKTRDFVLGQLKEPQKTVTRIQWLYAHPDESSFDVFELKDGRIFEWYSQPQRISGQPMGRVWSFRDITARKRAEQAVIDGQKQLRQIIDAVPHMIFAKNKKGEFLLANQAVADLYGKTLSEIVGKDQRDIHPVAAEAEIFLKDDLEVIKSGKPKVIPVRSFTDIYGNVRMLQIIKMPFEAIGIDEPTVLGVAVDVTEQKKVEEFRNDIIRTISHELRTPLSIQREGVDLLLGEAVGKINADQKKILEAVLRNVDRLSRMINSLLQISNIEMGKLKLDKDIVDLNELVKHVVFDFHGKAAQKNIELTAVFSNQKSMIFADPDKIEQVIGNLIHNSLKFTQKGSIKVIVKSLKNEIECTVQDTGVGLTSEEAGRMFEKFQQFGRLAGPGERGLGLGLSIARGIIEAHKGRIWTKSKSGEGTKVTFVLPLCSLEDAHQNVDKLLRDKH